MPSNQPRCLLLDTAGLAPLLAADRRGGVMDLAQALVIGAPWQLTARACAVVVQQGPARLAMIGYFDESDTARVEALRTQLDIARRGSRFVSYTEAEELVVALAARIRDRISEDVLASAHVLGIPRGGNIVLGILSYALPAASRQLEPTEQADSWIVVDDCAISGARFLEWLDQHPGPNVIFAHLYSHPDLREALERHPRVNACVSAADLVDHAPARLGDGYREWRDAWRDRDSGIWAGQPDYLAFAWNEPDTSIWNPVTQAVERGWNLVGPRRCLKNRKPIPEGSIQVLEHANGELQPSAGVMWATFNTEVIVADTAADEVLGLDGSAAPMWHDAISSSTELQAFERFSARFTADRAVLRRDWDQMIGQLIDRGVLVRH